MRSVEDHADGVGTRPRRSRPSVRFAALPVLVGVLLTYLASFHGRSSGYSFVEDGVLFHSVLVCSALVCFGRAALARTQRLPSVLLGLTVSAWATGNLIRTFHDRNLDPVPYPSLADAGYLSGYIFLIAALIALAYPELKGLSLGTFLDGVLGGLGCAVAGSIALVKPVLETLGGPPLTQFVTAAYPVFDLLMIAVMVGVLIVKGGQMNRAWTWLICGIVVEALADTIFLHQLANGTFQIGTPLDTLWAIGPVLIATSALSMDRPPLDRQELASPVWLLPNMFIFAAFALLAYGSLPGRELPMYAVALITAGLLVAAKRIALGLSAEHRLAASQRLAQTDSLTQLSNRRHFDEQVQRILLSCTNDAQVAMVMVDLNGFKAVNDTFGHHVGDELLRHVATRLGQVLRSGDVLARLGGDEFGLLLKDCDRASAMTIAHRLVTEISKPMQIGDDVHRCSASVGIAVRPDDGRALDVLLQRADIAMFDAKANSAGPTPFDETRHLDGRVQLNARDCLEHHELVVHFQPQFDLRDGRMTGVEALVRWAHPTRGLLLPVAFLPVFERAGLIGELTLEVLAISAEARNHWLREGFALDVSVNISPSALLDDDLTASIVTVLQQHAMSADVLTIEITEGAMLLDLDRSRWTLADLAAHGIRLSLDDYGIGYCSLTHLRDLPLQEIKIDRSFVSSLVPDSTDSAIVSSSLDLAETLGLRTVAVGVETADALQLLRDLGCQRAQGYLLARPVPADQVLRVPAPDWPSLIGSHLVGR